MTKATSVPDIGKIQVCGISCRLPDAVDVNSFRNLLFSGKCAVTSVPEDRWKKWPFYNKEPGQAGRTYTMAAGVLEDVWGFDPKAFNISPREAAIMDPQQRILLQLVWEALEDAGIPPESLSGQNVGVYVGVSSSDYSRRLALDPVHTSDPYLMTGNALSIVANRISHAFDLRGPSLAIDTACSSSLVALDNAFGDLKAGKIDTAIVGGINVIASPDPFGGFSAANMLSISGLCRSFGKDADGYVRAEGGVAMVLQTDAAAAKLGTSPRGSILATKVNSDGWTPGISLPSEQAQFQLLRDVYQQSSIDPDNLLFVEAHGTGTFVGDPIEASALGKALGVHRSNPLPIGSVKSNIGHLEPASGLAGVVKAIIALEENRLPATLHADVPNPDINFSELNLSLAQSATELKPEENRNLAGVNSFGFGGVNAHVVLQKSDAPGSVEAQLSSGSPPLIVSAHCENSLDTLLKAYQGRLEESDDSQSAKISTEAYYNRGLFSHRAIVSGTTAKERADALGFYNSGKFTEQVITAQSSLVDEPPVFVYSGNGSQHAEMCRIALENDEAYRNHFRRIDKQFKKLAGWSLLKVLEDPAFPEKLGSAEVAQPLLFADQVALTSALSDYGLKPAVVVGHSGGEISAACCSGAMPLDQALRTIIERSNCQEELRGLGTMAAVQAAAEDVLEALAEFGNPNITIAAENSPRSVTIVGPAEPLKEFLVWIRRKKRWAGVKLDVDYPYHSPMQDQVEKKFRESLKNLTPVDSNIPFYSSVTGSRMEGSDLSEDHWWSLIRSSVRFKDVIEEICSDGFRLFIECGSQPVLLSYIKDCVDPLDGEFALLKSFDAKDSRAVNPVENTLLRAVVNGANCKKEELFGKPGTYSRSLPTYPWQNQEFRRDNSKAIEAHFALNAGTSALLGRQTAVNSTSWTSVIDTNLMPDLADHIIGGSSILPGTGFLEAALCAASLALDTDQVEIRNMDIFAPLGISSGAASELRTTISEETRSLTISSRSAGDENRWQEHARCRVGKSQSAFLRNNQVGPDPEVSKIDESGDILYEYGRLVGLEYGEAFQRVERFRQISPTSVEVFMKPSENYPNDGEYVCIAPPAADAVLHGLLALLFRSDEFPDGLGFVPVFLKRLNLLQPGIPIFSGRVEVTQVGSRSIIANCTYFDISGQPVAVLEGIRLRAIQLSESLSMDEHVFRTELKSIRKLAQNKTQAFDGLEDPTELLYRVAASEEFSPNDDSHYILEAIAKAIAHETLFARCNSKNVFETKNLKADSDGGKVTLVLLDLLRTSDLATETANGYEIAAETGLPTSSELISGLLTDNPERIAECRILARLSACMPDLATGKLVPDPENILGRNNVTGYRNFATSSKRRRGFLEKAISEFTQAGDGIDPARVLVVSDEAELENHLMKSSLPENCEFEFWSVSKFESETVSGHANGAEKIPFANCFNLVVLSNADNPGGDFGSLASGATRIISAGGMFLLVQHTESSFDKLLACLDAERLKTDTQVRNSCIEDLCDESDWRQISGLAGFDRSSRASLPDNFYGTVCFTAQMPTSAAESPQNLNGHVTKFDFEEFVNLTTLEFNKAEFPSDVGELTWHENANLYTLSTRNHANGTGGDFGREWLFLPKIDDIALVRNVLEERIMFVARLFADLGNHVGEVCLVLPHSANYTSVEAISPSQSALWNMVRTARNEYPHLTIRTIDPCLSSDPAEAARLLNNLILDGLDDVEIVLKEKEVSALRVLPGLRRNCVDIHGKADIDGSNAELSVPLNGRIPDLEWSTSSRLQPDANQVEVEVKATGLNYRDVMWAMGLLPEEALEKGFSGASVGMECAGTVTRIGKNVTGLSVGDPVMAVGSSCFSSYVTVDASYCFKLADSIDMNAAAVMPVTFFTAYYSLVHASRVKAGETILVHGAAGGVGLAAIQIAKLREAKVFATAGSPDKRDLLRAIGVDEVFDSRSLEFEEQVMNATNGQGVDIVLNSLAGEAMERSLEVLKAFGRFVELGKQDFYANTKIGLRALRENIEYLSVDVDQLLAVKPELTKKIFIQIMKLFEAGEITPIPYYHFESHEVIEAFKFMQRSAHVGKITISPPKPENTRLSVNQVRFTANPAGAHIVAGGAGGLGLETARWLAHHGAKFVYLLGRRPIPSDAAQKQIDKLGSFGCSVEYVQCDVSVADELSSAIARIRDEIPIAGVINAAMHLEDVPMQDLRPDSIRATLAPKITGTENLSEATKQDSLDYFVVFSSVAALVGNQRQATYVAANAYLEALMKNRSEQGLPGLSVGWGAISDVGYLTENKAAAEVLAKVTGDMHFTSKKALDWLGKILSSPAVMRANPVVSVTDMNWSNLANHLPTMKTPTFRVIADLATEPSGITSKRDLRNQLEQLTAERAEKQLTKFIREEISKILRISLEDVDVDKPMTDLGMDSLMGVEFGMAAQQSLGDDIPLVSISDGASVRQVASGIVNHIKISSRETETGDNILKSLVAQHSGGQSTALKVSGPSGSSGADDGKANVVDGPN